MSWSWWMAWKDAGRPFFAGFFEGPRLWSTGEPLRDDLIWLPGPEVRQDGEGSPQMEDVAPVASGGGGDHAPAELVSLMTGLGDSVRPGDAGQ